MLDLKLLIKNTKIKNNNNNDILIYQKTISIANQPIYVFKDITGKEIKLNKIKLREYSFV